MRNDIAADMAVVAARVETRLSECLRNGDADLSPLFDAMRYSALAGGKRLRPYLTVRTAALCGGGEDAALDFACALEMIHTYSLIHDDLPCMDDDTMRRGKPTCHVAYGVANATLAGDALLTDAFRVAACAPAPADVCLCAVKTLAEAAGSTGMVGGQVMDMSLSDSGIPYLEKLQSKKTGALIECAVRLGALAANAPEELTAALVGYAAKIGLAFQIRDDLLDRLGDPAALGKSVGKDEREGKITFLTYLTEKEANARVLCLTQDACAEIAPYDRDGILTDLAEYLTGRDR